MNILFVGNTKETSTSLYYFSALARLGHKTLSWDPGYFETSGLFDRVVQGLNQGPAPAKVQRINETLARLCKENRFDLVFVLSENYVTKEAIETIRLQARIPPRFLYHSHDNVFAPGILKPADFAQTLCAYDRVFTTKSQNVERYKKLGQQNAHFLPSAFEPSIHRPIPKAQSRLHRTFDASFIGTYDGSRIAWLEKAGWDRTYVWGDGWRRFPEYSKHKDHIHPKAIYRFDFADVCSQSRCSLGLLRAEAGDRHTQRTFEIPACASLQLAPRNDEIQSFFEEDKEIVLFDSSGELKDKLDYYLSHESARLRIAQAGLERCLGGRHTYEDRVKTILETVTEGQNE